MDEILLRELGKKYQQYIAKCRQTDELKGIIHKGENAFTEFLDNARDVPAAQLIWEKKGALIKKAKEAKQKLKLAEEERKRLQAELEGLKERFWSTVGD